MSEQQDTLLEFPCQFPIKVMGPATDEFEYTVVTIVRRHVPDLSERDLPFVKELVLWALAEYKKLNRKRIETGFEFKDSYGAYLSNL